MDYLGVKDKIKVLLLVALIVATIIFFDNLSEIYLGIEHHLISLGLVKSLLYFILVVLVIVTVTPIPYSPFAVIAGAAFGPWIGALATLSAAVLGAVTAFSIGRLLHDFFWKKFEKNKIYRKMLEEDHKHVLKFIFLSRLMPQAPFDIVSYFSGITTIKVWKFALVNLLGMLPIVVILCFFGSQLESYRTTLLCIIVIGAIMYAIYRIIRYKRYYVKGY